MNPVLYPQRRHLDHGTPWGLEYSEFFLTICGQPRGLNQLCHPGMGERVLGLVRKYQESRYWHCSIFLLMPDHLHAIVQIPDPLRLEEVVRCFKQAATKQAGIRWQRGFFDHRIRQDESAQHKYRYIEMNPVRSGLIQKSEEWPWRIQFNDRGKEIQPSDLNRSIGQAAQSARPYRTMKLE